MAPAGNLDWLYHLLGWTLAAAGLLLLLWSLFWDRSRGRRRCPKCWYDMSGVPGLACPECGRAATNEVGFARTRRRWRWAGVSLLLLAAAATAGPARAIWLNEWRAVPTELLIRLPSYTHRRSLFDEIDRRLRPPGFTGLTVSSGPPRDMEPDWDVNKLSRRQWRVLQDQMFQLFGSMDHEAAPWSVTSVAWSLPEPLDCVRDINQKLNSGDLAVRVDAAVCTMLMAHRYNADANWTAGGPVCRAKCEPLVPGLVALLQLPASDSLLAPYPTIKSLRRSRMSGVPPSLPRPTSARAVARAAAADALGALAVADPTAIAALQAASADPDPWVSYFAAQALHQQIPR
jgi:hypothetical protein